MTSIDDKIRISDSAICRNIKNIKFSSRGAASQDILKKLRDFIEHIMIKFYAEEKHIKDIDDNYENICKAIDYVKTRGQLKVLYKFHDYLQITTSHYLFDEDMSERLMLKYYQNLLEIKSLLHERFDMDVLANLDDFPLHTDNAMQKYYEKIAKKVRKYKIQNKVASEKYYIQKIKPFFIDHRIFYEVTFTPANDHASKTNRVIAFTQIKITDYYASRFSIVTDSIEIFGKIMPILIINGWEVAIRDCEYKNYISIFSDKPKTVSFKEQQNIAKYLTQTRFSLSEIMDFPKVSFDNVMDAFKFEVRHPVFTRFLKKSRNIIEKHSAGENLLRYFLYRMNNMIIKTQYQKGPNPNLSELYLQNGCLPFDRMPYIFSPKGHNPRLIDLFDCIPTQERNHELFARFIRNNTEIKGQLFTTIEKIDGFGNVQALAQKYNDRLWSRHKDQSKLVIENGQIFINKYKDDTCFIINELKSLSSSGIKNYSNSVADWFSKTNYLIDCDEKKLALQQMFENSHVAIIYGSAGTGKSTLINHVAHLFAYKKKMFLSHTNPAVDNLRRRVIASNCTFLTISKFLQQDNIDRNYDLLVIDECSTVSNNDMREILEKAHFHLMLLVGDMHQINSIRFGNWFSAARKFIPTTSVFELTTPFRSNNEHLKLLWNRVRNMDDTVLELIAHQRYSTTLDASIFDNTEDDEIILCLNYDGLYGINNINRFLQESNPNKPVQWGIQQYKIGDPILFNDSDRFAPAIYNNMKGKIVGIKLGNPNNVMEYIQFDIKLDKVINEMDADECGFELLDNTPGKNSVIRFKVFKNKSADDDDERSSKSVIPFQIAYAVSIHKAQGLEYRSVKIVITNEVDELITHNIFYTAITRARKKLKIYWTPEVENKVLSNIRPKNINRDIELLKKYI